MLLIMTVSQKIKPTEDVLLTPFRSWTPCFCVLMLAGAILLFLTLPTPNTAIAFVVLCSASYLAALALMCSAVMPMICRYALARRLSWSIKGARLRACVVRHKLNECEYLEGVRSTIVLEVPRTSNHKTILKEIALYLRLNKFQAIEEQNLGSPILGTRMVFRSKMVTYGILCSLRPFRKRPNLALCVVHVMRLVG
jgi:hypothetical protein